MTQKQIVLSCRASALTLDLKNASKKSTLTTILKCAFGSVVDSLRVSESSYYSVIKLYGANCKLSFLYKL